eukprot:3510410-Rhodomonas_salina.1
MPLGLQQYRVQRRCRSISQTTVQLRRRQPKATCSLRLTKIISVARPGALTGTDAIGTLGAT